MGRHSLVSIATLLTTATVRAQNQSNTVYDLRTTNGGKLVAEANTVLPLRTCSDLTCLGNTSSLADAGPCYENDLFAVGVGIYPNAVTLNAETSLSLTLLSGSREVFQDSYFALDSEGDFDGVRYSDPSDPFFPHVPSSLDHKLFVGAPAGLDLREADPGCALMFTRNTETFGSLNMSFSTTEDNFQRLQNTSWCPGTDTFGFWHQSTESLVDWVREFRYQGGANATFSRCDALAKYVEIKIHEEFGFWGETPNAAIVVTGGAISGPDAASEPHIFYSWQRIEYATGNCPPVLPESYSFYNVSTTDLILQAGQEGYSHRYAGRAGLTPVVTAIFDGEEDDSFDPDVQLLCLETRDPKGAEVPALRFTYEARSAGEIGRGSPGWSAIIVAVAGVAIWNL